MQFVRFIVHPTLALSLFLSVRLSASERGKNEESELYFVLSYFRANAIRNIVAEMKKHQKDMMLANSRIIKR